MATGGLSAPNRPNFPGIDTFEGTIVQTSLWPEEGVELEGKRVGVIGTGSSGVQAIPELARVAEHLTVFQRTAAFTWPSQNRPLTDDEQAAIKARYRELRRRTGRVVQRHRRHHRRGDPAVRRPTTARSSRARPRSARPRCEELRLRRLPRLDRHREGPRRQRDGGRALPRDDPPHRARSRRWPRRCRRVATRSAASGRCSTRTTSRRSTATTSPSSTSARDRIEEVTPTGIRTTQGFVELDVIVLATGFDAMTGALTRIDVRGRGGRLLRDDWAGGPRTYLGVEHGRLPEPVRRRRPGQPGRARHLPAADRAAGRLDRRVPRATSTSTASPAPRPSVDAQDAWCDHVNEVAEGTMFTAPSCNSWYNGQNIEGKPRVFLPYVGGLPAYMARCNDVAANGYEGFALR